MQTQPVKGELQVSLRELADRANSAHGMVNKHGGAMFVSAKDAGLVLSEARELSPHGAWMSWLAENCKFSHTTAMRYIAISENWAEVKQILRMRGRVRAS